MNVTITKNSGGFSGFTYYQMNISITITESKFHDDLELEKTARENAQKILNERFPEANINTEEIFIHSRFTL